MRYILLFFNCCLFANPFVSDLYQQLAQEEENVFFSPYSLSCALGMAHLGAKGETRRQLEKGCAPFIECACSVANSVWIQEGFFLLPDYIAKVSEQFQAEAHEVDFLGEGALLINQWVEAKTEGKIADLITEGDLSAETRALLVNAIYYKGEWATPFQKERTAPSTFFLEEGGEVQVSMMRATGDFLFCETESATAVGLPYTDGLLFFAVLPKPGVLLEEIEDLQVVEEVLTGAQKDTVTLHLPKFNLNCRFSLKEPLSALGIDLPFSRFADFSGMTGRDDLYVDSILHQAHLSVDEEGAEAAAATAVVMNIKCCAPSKLFFANRPFLFFIADRDTHALLFLGRLKHPN